MNNDVLFWISFWKVVGTIVVAVCLTIASCSTINNKIDSDSLERLVATKADPVLVDCLKRGSSGDSVRAIICSQRK